MIPAVVPQEAVPIVEAMGQVFVVMADY